MAKQEKGIDREHRAVPTRGAAKSKGRRGAPKSQLKNVIWISLPVFFLGTLIAFAGCGGGEETGPLSADEKSYLNDAEQQAKVFQKSDALIAAGVLVGKRQSPSESGLPTAQMNAVQNKLDARRKLVDSWDGRDCPSKRLHDLCELWFESLHDQYVWDQRLIKFINPPYSAARFRATTRAGRKEVQSMQRSQALIKEIRHKAAGG